MTVKPEHDACVAKLRAEEGKPVPAGEDPPSEEGTAISEEAAAVAAAGPLSYVGTVTYSDDDGTTFKAGFKVGRLHTASELRPPEPVLSACGDDYSTGIASSLFARGEATITYEEGSLPYEFNVFGSGTEDGERQEAAHTALEIDGLWECTGENGVVTFEPGETLTFPFWMVAPLVISNAEPDIDWAQVDTWSIGAETGGIEVGDGLGVARTSGPGAVSCFLPGVEGMKGTLAYRLLLYGRPPIELPLLVNGESVPCKAA